MARVNLYGYQFDSDDLVLTETTLARIAWAARQSGSKCKGVGDFAEAYAALERAARNLLALRALHDQADLARTGRF